MSVALFFITHEGIASNLLTVAETIIKPGSNISYAEIAMDMDTGSAIDDIENSIAQLDTKEGILFFTDIYGSTPSNVAQQLADRYHAHLISGVNLPMIIRLLNYRNETEETLVQKALEGAKKSIQDNSPESD